MDLDLLKTFAEVSRTRHFGQAAENLFLTQSAVSARLRLLEQIVGVPLLTRTRGNIQPTPAGTKLLRHAEIILNSWNRARQDIAVENEQLVPIAIGGVPNIWDSVLQEWIHSLHQHMPDLAITAEVYGSDILIQRLNNGALDVGFMFQSPELTNVSVKALGEVELILVASRPGLGKVKAIESGFVMTDWGTAFANAFSRANPDAPTPKMRLGLARLVYDFLLSQGGSAYLPKPMVESDVEAGRLHRVAGAEVFARTAYAVINTNSQQTQAVNHALSFLSLDDPSVTGSKAIKV